jgi:excisionase family DNA binding protein
MALQAVSELSQRLRFLRELEGSSRPPHGVGLFFLPIFVLPERNPISMPKNLNDDLRLMTVKEIADYLSVSEYWVYKHARRHGVPLLKVGSFLRARRRDLDMWLDNQLAA